MNGEKATKNNIQVGTLLKLNKNNSGTQWRDTILSNNPKMDHLKVTKVYGSGHPDIFYVDVIDKNGKNLGGSKGSPYIAAGYEGKFDCEIYEPITYDINDMLAGLDKLEDKFS